MICILISTICTVSQVLTKNVWRRNWYNLHTYVRTQYKPKILHTQDPSLSSNNPNAIMSGTAIPPDKPLSQAPTRNLMAFPLPPSMMVEVLLSFLSSAHLSKIFTFQIFCSTYIHRNLIVQKNVWRRNWYSLHTYVRIKYKPKILHTQDLCTRKKYVCRNRYSTWELNGVIPLSSSLGKAKNYCQQQYFAPLEINKVLFYSEMIAFLLNQQKALDQSFPTLSWLTFGSEI